MASLFFFFFSSRRRHTRWTGDWSSDVCSSDLPCAPPPPGSAPTPPARGPAGARGRPRNASSVRVAWVSPSSTPHPIPPHVGGGNRCSATGSAPSSTPPPILPHVGGRDRWCALGSALHSSTPTSNVRRAP